MNEKRNGGFLMKLSAFIVDKRNLFFLLYAIALIFCVFSMNWVQVENDVTTYLPETTETRQGLIAMNENFTTFATANPNSGAQTYYKKAFIGACFGDLKTGNFLTPETRLR